MPHISKSVHRGGRRSRPSSFCTWKGLSPYVLGSLVIRLSDMGYGVLFGTTSDGGRLALHLYLGEQKWSVYVKEDVHHDELFLQIAKVMGWSDPAPVTPVRAKAAPVASPPPSAAIRAETAPERAERLFEEKQRALQERIIMQVTDGRGLRLDKKKKEDTII